MFELRASSRTRNRDEAASELVMLIACRCVSVLRSMFFGWTQQCSLCAKCCHSHEEKHTYLKFTHVHLSSELSLNTASSFHLDISHDFVLRQQPPWNANRFDSAFRAPSGEELETSAIVSPSSLYLAKSHQQYGASTQDISKKSLMNAGRITNTWPPFDTDTNIQTT